MDLVDIYVLDCNALLIDTKIRVSFATPLIASSSTYSVCFQNNVPFKIIAIWRTYPWRINKLPLGLYAPEVVMSFS